MKLRPIHKIIIAVTAAVFLFSSGFWIGYSKSKTTINVTGIPQSSTSTVNSSNSNSMLININTADKEELELLPGIGPALSDAIIEYRTVNGTFDKIEDIMNVGGISLMVFRSIESLITV